MPVFPEIVLFLIINIPPLLTPAPKCARLSAIVVLLIVIVPELRIPPADAAALSLIVLSSMIIVPPKLESPPPALSLSPRLCVMLVWVIVTEPSLEIPPPDSPKSTSTQYCPIVLYDAAINGKRAPVTNPSAIAIDYTAADSQLIHSKSRAGRNIKNTKSLLI